MPSVQVKDYYQMLGVPRTATEKEIRSAYRKQARQHHPDLNPGDKNAEDRFREINEAHEVLTDADKRKLYDRFGEDWQRYREAGFTGDEQFTAPGPAGAPGSRAGRSATFDPNDFNRWYSNQDDGSGGYTFYSTDEGTNPTRTSSKHSLGTAAHLSIASAASAVDLLRRGHDLAGTRATRPQRGEDVEVPVEISFDEAFRGTKRQIQLQVSEPCPTCGGTGEVRGQECPTCDGTGFVRRTKTLEVNIPAGIDTGKRVRVAGQGGPGLNGGSAGDVNLIVTVRPDRRFEREGDNLRTEVDVPVTTAVLGGEVEVPTPTGRVALTVPPETQSGRSFRLRGMGMPKLRGGKAERGDLMARARIVTPTNLSDRERELFEELRQLRQEKQS